MERSGKSISGQLLEPLLPANLPGFEGRSTVSVRHRELGSDEVLGVYGGPSGSSVLIAMADLGQQPKLYRNFLSGGGLRQSSVGSSFGLSFRQASLQGSGNYGLVLGQNSPAIPGQVSGVVGMAQASQPVHFTLVTQSSPQFSPQASPQFSPQTSPQVSPQASPQFSPQASPQFSPQASPQFSPQVSPQASPQFSPQVSPQFSPQFSPQTSPQVSPQFSPQASPQFSPQVSPQFSPQASPQFSPQASPQFSPQVSPQFSPQASPQVSPQFSPQASPQFSPQASPQFSPQASPQFSPQFSPQASPAQATVVVSGAVGDKRDSAVRLGQTSLTPGQVSDQLQRSGVDLKALAQISQESPFSLSQASSPREGSYIRPFGVDTGHDVAGWELYDGQSKNGTLILGIDDRVGILVEANNVFPQVLLEIASRLDFGQLDQVIRSHAA